MTKIEFFVIDDSTLTIGTKSGLKELMLEILGHACILDKTYNRSILKALDRGIKDGAILEDNVKKGKIVVIGLEEKHRKLADKYSDLFKLKRGDEEILALCHQVSARGIIAEDDDFHSKKEEILAAFGGDFRVMGLFGLLLKLLATGKIALKEFDSYVEKISRTGRYKEGIIELVKEEGKKMWRKKHEG